MGAASGSAGAVGASSPGALPRDVVLYGYWRSSASWRVRIGLNLKGVPYRTQPVHLVNHGGEQRSEAHAARNPLKQVPVLEAHTGSGPIQLTQSIAILAWLDAVLPDPPLIPADPVLRARAFQLAEVVNSGIQPLQNLSLLQALEAMGQDKLAWGRTVIGSGLDALEQLAAPVAGRFLVGDAVSLADLCLIPQLYNARRFGVALDAMPTLLRVEEACNAIPAFAEAHPSRQPDAT